jgi:hypothetical protein
LKTLPFVPARKQKYLSHPGGKILAAVVAILARDPASMLDKRKAEAIAAARREIARRIARFCTGLSTEEYNALLDRMAQVQWKYDTLPNIGEPDIEKQLRELME